jgi:hypothetical protein
MNAPAGMVDGGEKDDMVAPLDKRMRHLEITGGGSAAWLLWMVGFRLQRLGCLPVA